MHIAIVVLHYKNRHDTLECLRSITKLDVKGFKVNVILVDNSTTSTSEEFHSTLFARSGPPSEVSLSFTMIPTGRNLGYAGGVNVGIKKALADEKCGYVLILNNDTVLPKDLLAKLLERPCDIASPVVEFLSTAGSKVYDFGGVVNWWTGRTHHIEHKTYNIKQIANDIEHKTNSIEHFGDRNIDYVSGCCMFVSREVFEKIGLFDEDYFFYFEDVDFCVRAQNAGFRIENVPTTKIFHKLGGSIGRWTNEAIARNLLGNFIFVSKHFGWRIPVAYGYLFLISTKILFNKLIGK